MNSVSNEHFGVSTGADDSYSAQNVSFDVVSIFLGDRSRVKLNYQTVKLSYLHLKSFRKILK